MTPGRPDLTPDRKALWEKFTGGERLAYGLGYGDGERAAAPVTDAGLREIAAMLDDELRRVEAGYSTPKSLRRARETYARQAEKETA